MEKFPTWQLDSDFAVETSTRVQDEAISSETVTVIVDSESDVETSIQTVSPKKNGRKLKRGRGRCWWTAEEHQSFVEGLKEFGKGKWVKISKYYVPTRTARQICNYSQRCDDRLRKQAEALENTMATETSEPDPLRALVIALPSELSPMSRLETPKTAKTTKPRKFRRQQECSSALPVPAIKQKSRLEPSSSNPRPSVSTPSPIPTSDNDRTACSSSLQSDPEPFVSKPSPIPLQVPATKPNKRVEPSSSNPRPSVSMPSPIPTSDHDRAACSSSLQPNPKPYVSMPSPIPLHVPATKTKPRLEPSSSKPRPSTLMPSPLIHLQVPATKTKSRLAASSSNPRPVLSMSSPITTFVHERAACSSSPWSNPMPVLSTASPIPTSNHDRAACSSSLRSNPRPFLSAPSPIPTSNHDRAACSSSLRSNPRPFLSTPSPLPTSNHDHAACSSSLQSNPGPETNEKAIGRYCNNLWQVALSLEPQRSSKQGENVPPCATSQSRSLTETSSNISHRIESTPSFSGPSSSDVNSPIPSSFFSTSPNPFVPGSNQMNGLGDTNWFTGLTDTQNYSLGGQTLDESLTIKNQSNNVPPRAIAQSQSFIEISSNISQESTSAFSWPSTSVVKSEIPSPFFLNTALMQASPPSSFDQIHNHFLVQVDSMQQACEVAPLVTSITDLQLHDGTNPVPDSIDYHQAHVLGSSRVTQEPLSRWEPMEAASFDGRMTQHPFVPVSNQLNSSRHANWFAELAEALNYSVGEKTLDEGPAIKNQSNTVLSSTEQDLNPDQLQFVQDMIVDSTNEPVRFGEPSENQSWQTSNTNWVNQSTLRDGVTSGNQLLNEIGNGNFGGPTNMEANGNSIWYEQEEDLWEALIRENQENPIL
ncbi:hypothetical protein ACHQM5_024200 [Ranunculus cassubicifolius]